MSIIKSLRISSHRPRFNIDAELNRIGDEISNHYRAEPDGSELPSTFLNILEESLSDVIEKYHISKSDLDTIHAYLDKLLLDGTGADQADAKSFGEYVNSAHPLFQTFLFCGSGATHAIEALRVSIPLVKQQIDNTYISERRRRRISVIAIVIAIISAAISLAALGVSILNAINML